MSWTMGGPAPIAPSEILRAEHHARLVALLDCEILREQRDEARHKLFKLWQSASVKVDELEDMAHDLHCDASNSRPESWE